jgi:hypothetical protein
MVFQWYRSETGRRGLFPTSTSSIAPAKNLKTTFSNIDVIWPRVRVYLHRIVESVESTYVLSADLQVDCALNGHGDAFVFDFCWGVDDHHTSNRVLE